MAGSSEAPRRRAAVLAPPEPAPPKSEPEPVKKPAAPLPFLLDFFPLEDEKNTRLAAFFRNLKEGRLTTTKCRSDGTLAWPPRVVCPQCHQADLDWVDLPMVGRIYAFSAVLMGAPLGMESEVPFVVGLVDIPDVPFRLFGRIVGTPWEQCHVGQKVRAEPYELPDGRVFYRFRTVG
ncbi:MAG: OB-fold domain-containing protein [Thermoplasmata archaeon]|nr:OB-fold domain-containing protein [Thermoplasmata archaeon]MCI4355540.1 OB-fold domain-containing protein [Thermoplasmata archaeon]